MESSVMQDLRSWRTDAPTTPAWTDETVRVFAELYEKIGDGPTNNRRIAELMGDRTFSCAEYEICVSLFRTGFHSNHIAHFKRMFNSYRRSLQRK
jgi:hypothetical protein